MACWDIKENLFWHSVYFGQTQKKKKWGRKQGEMKGKKAGAPFWHTVHVAVKERPT